MGYSPSEPRDAKGRWNTRGMDAEQDIALNLDFMDYYRRLRGGPSIDNLLRGRPDLTDDEKIRWRDFFHEKMGAAADTSINALDFYAYEKLKSALGDMIRAQHSEANRVENRNNFPTFRDSPSAPAAPKRAAEKPEPGREDAQKGDAGTPASGKEIEIKNYRDLLGPAASAALEKSPTAMKEIKHLQSLGYYLALNHSSGGTVTDRNDKVIVLDPDLFDDPAMLVDALAHEMGHATDGYVEDLSSRRAYIGAALPDEAAAVWNEFVIAGEINAQDGDNSPVSLRSNPKYKAIFEKYHAQYGSHPSNEVLDQIGALYAQEHPSNNPDETYEKYYSDYYDKRKSGTIKHQNKIKSFSKTD